MSLLDSFDIPSYDLFFIDAAKKEYSAYYETIVKRAIKRSVLLVDNVLWKGKVLDSNPKGISQMMNSFNELVRNDSRVENFIMPIRDGINVITIL